MFYKYFLFCKMVKVNLLICNYCFYVFNRVYENVLNFVDFGLGEIDSGIE